MDQRVIPLLRTIALTVTVPGRTLVSALDCTLANGEFLALLGGNGAGKSLLLRTLAGLRAPQGGNILLTGDDIPSLDRRTIARRLGFLPQDPEAAPQGSVQETLMLGRFAHLGFFEPTTGSDLSRVDHALDVVGLAGFGRRDLGSLSGGEQRRAAIARLLVQAPSLYLLDEPTNHLDPAQQIAVLQRMRELAREGAGVIASLHDPNLALRFADRIGLMAGDGSMEIVSAAALAPAHLEKLYGLRYGETRLGAQRLMAPD
jgi:iron complex transport system ATP-binding protein